MTRIDRSKLVEAFQARFSETRSIWHAVDAVATTIEAHFDVQRDSAPGMSLFEKPGAEHIRHRVQRQKTAKASRAKKWPSDSPVTSAQILEAVAASNGISVRLLLSGSRQKDVAMARHESIWLHRRVRAVFRVIADIHGFNGHQPADLACRKIQRLVDADAEYGRRLLALIASGAAADAQRAA